MDKKIKLLIFISCIFLIGIVNAALEVKQNSDDSLRAKLQTPVNNNITSYNTNSSNFWDNLNTPSDISGSSFWYNQTSASGDYNYNQSGLTTLQQAYDNGKSISMNQTGILLNLTPKCNVAPPIGSYCTNPGKSYMRFEIDPRVNTKAEMSINVKSFLSETTESFFKIKREDNDVFVVGIKKQAGEAGIWQGTPGTSEEFIGTIGWAPLNDSIYDLGCMNCAGTTENLRWKDLYLSGTIKGSGSPEALNLNASGEIKATKLWLAENVTETPTITLDYSTGLINTTGNIQSSNITLNNNTGSRICYNVLCTAYTWYNGSVLITKVT